MNIVDLIVKVLFPPQPSPSLLCISFTLCFSFCLGLNAFLSNNGMGTKKIVNSITCVCASATKSKWEWIKSCEYAIGRAET